MWTIQRHPVWIKLLLLGRRRSICWRGLQTVSSRPGLYLPHALCLRSGRAGEWGCWGGSCINCMLFGVRPSKLFLIDLQEICLHALHWECREEYGERFNVKTHHPLTDKWTEPYRRKGGCTEISLEPNVKGSAESFLRWWKVIDARQWHRRGHTWDAARLGQLWSRSEDQARSKSTWTLNGDSPTPLSASWDCC